MASIRKISMSKWLCFAALLLCGCTQVADYCSDYNPYDPASQFCGADGTAYPKCGGRTYNTATQGCDASNTVRDKCANGSVPEPNMPCGDGENTPHTHVWGGWVITLSTSCEAPGLETNTCQTDGSHVLEQEIPQLSSTACEPTHTHSFGDDWTTTAPATCTVPGQQTRQCECEYSEIQQIDIDPSAHLWSDWAITTHATCNAAGEKKRICELNHDHVETETMPQLSGEDCQTFLDSRNNKTYKWVTIGTQTWMAENLHYNAAGSWCYDHTDSNCDKYSRLYDWATAMTACPAGWHLPNNAEWTMLINYVASPAGTNLKAKSGWNGAGNGTDAYGFSALPGGNGYIDGSFGNAGNYGYWWSATEYENGSAYSRYMSYNRGIVDEGYFAKVNMFSVRCVKNN